MSNDDDVSEEVNKDLEHWIREGIVDHTGFDEQGEDLFQINEKGIEYIQEQFASNPSYVLLYLNICLEQGGQIGFWKAFNRLAGELIIGCSNCGTIQDTPKGPYCHECGDDLTKQEISLTEFQKEVIGNMSAKPQVIDSFNKMFDHMKKQGLSEDDIIHLIQKRTNPRVKITDIKATFRAIRTFERQIDRATNQD